jgi:hypothetical protein
MRQGKQQHLVFLFAWLFVVPTCVEGLMSNSWKETLFGGKPPPKEQLTSKQEGALLLQELNLTSSTEPKRFSVEPKALPDILTASIPVRTSTFIADIVYLWETDSLCNVQVLAFGSRITYFSDIIGIVSFGNGCLRRGIFVGDCG